MVAAAVVGGASLVGGLASASSAGKAADAQGAAAQASTEAQLKMYNQTRADLSPYTQAGTSATNALAALMGLGPSSGYYTGGTTKSVSEYDAELSALQSQLTAAQQGGGGGGGTILGLSGSKPGKRIGGGALIPSTKGATVASIQAQIDEARRGRNLAIQAAQNPSTSPLDSPLLKTFNMSQAELERTPGYQFNLKHGLKAVQNSAAARGLGVSGAAMKGAAEYATGLADNTYQNQFNNYVTNQTNQYNRLMGLANQGAGAAAQTGEFGTQTAANIGSNLVGAANAQGAAYISQGNALANAAGNVGSYYAMKGIYG